MKLRRPDLPRLPELGHEQLVPAAFFGGFALVAIGVGLWSLPAGLIVAGILLVAGATLYETGSEGDE